MGGGVSLTDRGVWSCAAEGGLLVHHEGGDIRALRRIVMHRVEPYVITDNYNYFSLYAQDPGEALASTISTVCKPTKPRSIEVRTSMLRVTSRIPLPGARTRPLEETVPMALPFASSSHALESLLYM